MNHIIRNIFAFLLGLVFSLNLYADEGMWLPYLLDQIQIENMQSMGLKLSAEDIYNINHSSLKDAIVIFGRGCTGEVVSADGLVFTNHHCGFGAIQSSSSIENDYLKEGFWARNLKEEIPIAGLTVQFLINVTDVTNEMLEGVNFQMPENQCDSILKFNEKRLLEAIPAQDGMAGVIKEFYAGNQYYLFVYQTYKDIRLVGAPPTAIGKFGGDTDNWMWPRHTGDFSVFRIYTSPSGKPATYQVNNIPLKAKRYLTINAGGIKKGDFAMIMGYPGRTDRYATSWGVAQAMNLTNPSIIKIRDKKLEILRNSMAANDEIRIKYAAKYAGISNYWKYYIGQNKQLKRLKVYEKKKQQEKEFADWVSADPQRYEKYGGVLTGFEQAYQLLNQTAKPLVYIREAAFGPEIISFASRSESLINQSVNKNRNNLLENLLLSAKEMGDSFFRNFDQSTDKRLFAAMMSMYYNDMDPQFVPQVLLSANKKYKGQWDKYADEVYQKSIFSSMESFTKFLNNPSINIIKDDPIYQLAVAFKEMSRKIEAMNVEARDQLKRNKRLYVEAVQLMYPNRSFYPDANQTLRLTYGTIQDYQVADAIEYNYFTTHFGILEKEDPSNPDFQVPSRLKEVFNQKYFSPYYKNDTVVTCFLTNNDITGGNSGSPVLNGDGELIGLAFDGNWEAMSGDIAYEPELQRTINVDIRYVLFLIDKYAHSHHIMRELSIKYER